MSWTDPRTWAVGEVVTANLLNEQLRDNLNALHTTNGDEYTLDESTDYTTTSTSFVDVDATNLAVTLTTSGGDLLIGFSGGVYPPAGIVYFTVDVDGSPIMGDDGIVGTYRSNNYLEPVSFIVLKTGLSAESHTVKLQWKVSASTAILYAGAGTSTKDIHPQFWALEV